MRSNTRRQSRDSSADQSVPPDDLGPTRPGYGSTQPIPRSRRNMLRRLRCAYANRSRDVATVNAFIRSNSVRLHEYLDLRKAAKRVQ